MKKQRTMLQTKEQNKTSEKVPDEMEICDLPHKELEIMVIMMLTVLGRMMDEPSENFNKWEI